MDFNSKPQLYLGETLPEIPIAKNSKYAPLKYRFEPYMKNLLITLWNNGEERELTRKEIFSKVGSGAYGNHNKLSFKPWDLIENNPIADTRRLTENGRQFILGQIKNPQYFIYDYKIEDYIPSNDSNQIF